MTLKPHTRTRRLSGCYLHPSEPVTGFCASCLRDRLAGLDPSVHPEPSSSSTTTFVRNKASALSSSLSPELRRTKSVSAGKCGSSSSFSEPRRKSCDVRVQKTLALLFDLDDEKTESNKDLKVETKNVRFSKFTATDTVFESGAEGENGEKIRVSEDILIPNVNVDGEFEEEEPKTMQELIDLECQNGKKKVKDLREIAGNFWDAASVFSKKLRKWSQKHKMKNLGGDNVGCNGGGDLSEMRNQKLFGRQVNLRETQSEIGEYGFGRRSCDTEPRFSVDAGRMSVDDSRFSLDEPRASWDGYLIARTIPRLTPMLSVVDSMILPRFNRSDNRRMSRDGPINAINEDDSSSGGSAQTNSDSSSSQRGSSFDRSSSFRSSANKKALGSVVDEMNFKASPANVDVFHPTKLVITERELKNWHLNSLKDDHLEKLEPVSQEVTSVKDNDSSNGFKKSNRWRNVWGFIHRFGDKKYQNFTANVIDHSVGEVNDKQTKEADGGVKAVPSGKHIRSSSVSSRNSCDMVGSYQRAGNVVETSKSVTQGREQCLLERNQSAKYSSSNSDNGMLRFHFTPLNSYRSKSGKYRLQNPHSVARMN
ncbi:unnamed protein product [Ilex paraguariensis]|uniref:Uncharacterized protein n=1 Tax=Ilex paraguariensis TaxID=185542 RepID=A0ABC8T813_9AQUA